MSVLVYGFIDKFTKSIKKNLKWINLFANVEIISYIALLWHNETNGFGETNWKAQFEEKTVKNKSCEKVYLRLTFFPLHKCGFGFYN